MAYRNLIDWKGLVEEEEFKAGTEYIPVSEKRTAELLTHKNSYGSPLIEWVDEGDNEDVETTKNPLDDMNKDELMVFLDEHEVEYKKSQKKDELLELAKGV